MNNWNNWMQYINVEPFFNLYKSKDIVYPNAIARHFKA